jgi:uncharacterized membrane-anchored protein
MTRLSRALAAAALAACTLHAAAAADPSAAAPDPAMAEIRNLHWQKGPATGAVDAKSSIAIPKDAAFLDSSSGSRFLELNGNLASPGTSILATRSWWAAFDFSPVGYVKDDEKIDADALLKSIKDNDETGNAERRKRGFAELHTEGWYVPPHYDNETKHLEWGLRLSSPGSNEPIVNYTVRLLGRTGVENVVLVSSPQTLDADVRSFKSVLQGFQFNGGERYDEFKPGDHVAEFGLGALVAGGAAAIAVKTGLWKVILGSLAAFWKVIAIGFAAVAASIGKLFKRKTT